MRIALYTHPALFEPALSLADALADSAEVHLLLEVHPEKWSVANFEGVRSDLPAGLVAADAVLAPSYPPAVRRMWRKAASFHLVVHSKRQGRNLNPLRTTLDVLRWIRDKHLDVLHIDDVDISPRLALGLAVAGAPCPVLIGCHDPDPHSGERHWRRKHATRVLAFSRADAVLVHHEGGRSALRRRHPRLRGRVHTVRLGTYDFLRHLARPPDPAADAAGPDHGPVVLLFGRLTPYKGIEELFRAAPLVARAVPGVRFVIAGKPVAGYLPPRAPRLEGSGQVETRYGYVASTAIAALFRQAEVAVCPYTDASQSGVVLTAFAFGCPVVATSVGGMAEYVEDGVTGLLVPPNDHHALAAALIRCLREPGLVARLREGVAAVAASDLSWKRAGSELLSVYAVVARGRAAGRHRGRSGDPGQR
ncbi:MAG: glycosyltransferase family 4 protein [Propionibacteriales bacterium]|nr:glycosyltransferase family 4 protein [Propionibacteriales bacterium]